MNHALILAPVFVLIALTFALLIWQARARIAALREGRVKLKDIALGQNAWPDKPAQLNRAYQNQLEMPVLFYALVALVLITGKQDTAFVAMEWLFVAARLAHAFVHVTTNHVTQRFWTYTAGLAALALMWLVFAAKIVAGAI